jgi:hypothetical protein
MTTKYVTYVGSVAANSTTSNAVATQDDNQVRTITGIFSGDTTKLNRTQLALAGKVMVDIDDSAFSAANGLLPVSVSYPVGVLIFLGFQNGTGGAVNNQPIVVQYTVPI